MATRAATRALAVLLSAHSFGPTWAQYDCNAEYAIWQWAWTPDWKAWCCEHHQKGCPPTTTEATTSRTSTSTVTTLTTTSLTTTVSSTVTLMQGHPRACKANCQMNGQNGTCLEQIRWVSEHDAKDEASPADAAVELVSQECPICGDCSITRDDTDASQGIVIEDACDTKCEVGNHTATCSERILWALTHKTCNQAAPQTAARLLVANECHFCGACILEDIFVRKFDAPGEPIVEYDDGVPRLVSGGVVCLAASAAVLGARRIRGSQMSEVEIAVADLERTMLAE